MLLKHFAEKDHLQGAGEERDRKKRKTEETGKFKVDPARGFNTNKWDSRKKQQEKTLQREIITKTTLEMKDMR